MGGYVAAIELLLQNLAHVVGDVPADVRSIATGLVCGAFPYPSFGKEVHMPSARIPLWVILVIGSAVVGSLFTSAVSQEASPARCDVAVVDISEVFEKYERFQAKMLQLKQDVESYELVLKAVQKDIQELKELLNGLEKGSRRYSEVEGEIETKTANVQAEMNIRRKKFLQSESEVYFESYGLVQKKVEDVARKRGARIVFRFNNDAINPLERESVLQGVNCAIIFQDGLDITDQVVETLNKS